ncbi:PX domain protein [Aspergillus luchuensis IFO 4308]|nr:PX domain protein [Aspergillus luchuensis IFO 4308]
MEPANEDIASVPPHQPRPSSPTQSSSPPSDIINNDTIAASLSDGVAVSNGSILPRAQDLSNKDRPVSGIVPPYWSHHRNASRASHISLDQAPGITLEDHTEDPDCETSRGLWAKSVVVDDHVVVQGKTGIGSYVVWNCRIQTLDGGPITVRLRYSEFDDLRQRLVASFPHAKNALPPLPPKSVIFKFRPSFLESRRVGLEYFLK